MIRLFCKKYIWLGWKLSLRYWSHFGGSLWTFKTKLFSSIIPWFKHWFCANVLALCLNFNCLGLSMVSSYMSHLMFAQRSNLYAFSVSLWSFWVLVYSFWERERKWKKKYKCESICRSAPAFYNNISFFIHLGRILYCFGWNLSMVLILNLD